MGPVRRIGQGTWHFGSREWGYGASSAARDIVQRTLALGATLFDTVPSLYLPKGLSHFNLELA